MFYLAFPGSIDSSFGHGPATSKPHCQSGSGDAKFSRPIVQGLSFAIMRQQMVVSFVPSLLQACRPVAVVRRVRAVVVSTLDRVIAAWTRTHISDEVGKPEPAVADRNTSSAVDGELLVFGIGATHFHRIPDQIFRVVNSSKTAMIHHLVTVT